MEMVITPSVAELPGKPTGILGIVSHPNLPGLWIIGRGLHYPQDFSGDILDKFLTIKGQKRQWQVVAGPLLLQVVYAPCPRESCQASREWGAGLPCTAGVWLG